MRHLLSLKEQTRDDVLTMLRVAMLLKQKRAAGIPTKFLPEKTLIMLFQKTSTRTRLSFEAAMTELGGHAIFLDAKTSQFSLTDFRDEIQAVMRFGHALMFRAMEAKDVELAASFNRIPVIDACSNLYHPAQALSDLLTMVEYAGSTENINKVAWLGSEGNVSASLMRVCTLLGIEFAVATPEPENPGIDPELDALTKATGLVKRTTNIAEALHNAQFVHTDTWMNMEFFENGKVKPEFQEIYDKKKQLLMPYQLNAPVINTYAPTARIMHCMPCHTGYEISRDAIDHPNAIIFDQAENRLHMQKAILLWLLEKEKEVLG